ncbi:MAG: MFS transporter [Clostridia bacterium]|nr:MFS transporter [Clostridia bacterium]
MKTRKKAPKIWSKNFTILTLGSFVSMLGNSVSGYIISLMIFDMTGSVFLFSVFTVSFYLPKMLFSMFAGAYMDRFSRKRVIYTLDFTSAFLYGIIFFILFFGLNFYWLFLILVLIVGSINGIYEVAFNSLFPNTISKDAYSKAYAVSSMIQPLALCMIPVASLIYYNVGSAAPLFIFNVVAFLTAAIFETRIDCPESHVNTDEKKLTFSAYKEDIKEGFNYTASDKGLMAITVYFCIMNFASGAYGTLALPFFKSSPEHFAGASSQFPLIFSLTDRMGAFGANIQGIFEYLCADTATLYTFVLGFGVAGRLLGGIFQYRLKYNRKMRFTVSVVCCVLIGILDMIMLYLPARFIMLCCLLTGLLSIAVYNIRLSTTQAYVSDLKRARFVSFFEMMFAGGNILGQIFSGILGEFIHSRFIISAFNVINIIALFAVIVGNVKSVKKIYNIEIKEENKAKA